MGIYNCDWLSFTADFSRYNAIENDSIQNVLDPDQNKHLAHLFSQLDEQREKPDATGYIDLGLWSFQVMNHGSRSYYYILHNDDLELRFMRYRSKKADNFPVYVHFKSQFLWAEIFGISTLEQKYSLVIEWLEQLLNGKYQGSKINRLDLAYHTDDVPDDFNSDDFVGRHTLDTTRRTHRRTSGVDIGSRKSEKLFLRCYDKYLEARSTKKSWFFMIWERAGLNIRKVWNIEFQMKREFFTDTQIRRKHLDTAEDVIAQQHNIWWYLTNEWVTYRVPGTDSRRTRWAIHDWWTGIMEFYEASDRIDRGKQKELPTVSMLIPGANGFLTSYAARTGTDLHDGSLLSQLYRDLIEYEKQSGKQFDDVVKLKHSLIDPTKQHVPSPVILSQQEIAAAVEINLQVDDSGIEKDGLKQVLELRELQLGIDFPADFSHLLKNAKKSRGNGSHDDPQK